MAKHEDKTTDDSKDPPHKPHASTTKPPNPDRPDGRHTK